MEQPKNKRIILSQKKYAQLCLYIYERDVWCQQCGEPFALSPPHHVKLRSQGGNDSPNNLVLLCRGCHLAVHCKGLELKPEIYEMLANEPEEL